MMPKLVFFPIKARLTTTVVWNHNSCIRISIRI